MKKHDFKKSESAVVTDWDEIKECKLAEKKWVNPYDDIDFPKDEDESGNFLRIYCLHDFVWCTAELGLDCCPIYEKHRKDW